jgi:hypothetical protein
MPAVRLAYLVVQFFEVPRNVGKKGTQAKPACPLRGVAESAP